MVCKFHTRQTGELSADKLYLSTNEKAKTLIIEIERIITYVINVNQSWIGKF